MEIDLLSKNKERFYSEETQIKFNKYIKGIIYILTFLVPLLFFPWTSDILEFNKQFLIVILSGIALICYLGLIIQRGKLILKKSLANYAVLIYVSSVVLTTIFSNFRYQSIFGSFGNLSGSLINSIALGVFFFLILNIFDKRDLKKLLSIFGLSLFLALIIGFFHILGINLFNFLGIKSRVFNTIGTINSLGIIAAILLVLSFVRLDEDGKYFTVFSSYLRFPAMFLSLFLIILLNWWAIWLVVIIGLSFIVVARSLSGQWRMLNYFWPVVIIVLGVIFTLFQFTIFRDLIKNLPIEVSLSFKASFQIAKQSFIKDPLFGVGPNNFRLAYDLFKPASINNTALWNIKFTSSVSEFSNLLISNSLIGFIGFLAFVICGFYLSFKGGHGYNFNKNNTLNLLAVFGSLVGAFLVYPFNTTLSFSTWFLFSLIALAAFREDELIITDFDKSPYYSLGTSLSFVAVLVLVVIGFYFLILRYYGNIKFVQAVNSRNPADQIRILVNAINIDRNEDLYPRQLANTLIREIDQNIKNLNQIKDEKQRQEINSRIQNFLATSVNISKDLTDRHPSDSVNWFSRGLVYESLIGILSGSEDWAIKMYQEYLKISPKDPQAYFRIGNIYLNRAEFLRQRIAVPNIPQQKPEDLNNIKDQIFNDLSKAVESFSKAIELKQDYILAIYNLGVVYERQGKIKEAINQLELIRSVNPLDPNLAFQLGLLYYRDGRKDLSFKELQRAINIFQDFSNARWYLALLYEERGEIEKALEELRKIEKLNPDNEILERKIADLEAGKRSIPPEKVTSFKPLEEKEEKTTKERLKTQKR